MLGQFISTSHYAHLLARGRNETPPLLEFNPRSLNPAKPGPLFLVQPQWGPHALFFLNHFFQWGRQLPPKNILYPGGKHPWGTPIPTPP